jgi:hypothetical protein
MTTEVNHLLEAIVSGAPDASAQLLPLVFDDLRRYVTLGATATTGARSIESNAVYP